MEDLISPKSLSLLRYFFRCDIVVFFETSVLKELHVLSYLHSNSVVLMPSKLHNIAIYLLFLYLINFRSCFYDNVFYKTLFYDTLFFDCSIRSL